MRFGIINVGATFQQAMDIMFNSLIGQSVTVYLDDGKIFSKKRYNHFRHPSQIFMWCPRYEIYLNTKKRIFKVSKGNLLGHIIAKSGIKLDLEWVNTIA